MSVIPGTFRPSRIPQWEPGGTICTIRMSSIWTWSVISVQPHCWT